MIISSTDSLDCSSFTWEAMTGKRIETAALVGLCLALYAGQSRKICYFKRENPLKLNAAHDMDLHTPEPTTVCLCAMSISVAVR